LEYVSRVFEARRIKQSDASFILLNFLNNLVVHSSLKNRSDKEIVHFYLDALEFIDFNSQKIGTLQLLAELGAKSDIVNTKFKGALFTYQYAKNLIPSSFSIFSKIFSPFRIIGFEVPVYLVKSGRQVSFIFQTLQGNKLKFALVSKRSIRYLDSELVSIDSDKLRIKSLGTYTIIKKRKIDLVYKKGGNLYFNEMKNYLGSSNLTSKENRNEWFFDLLMSSYSGKLNFSHPWVVKNSYFQEENYEKKISELKASLFKLSKESDFKKIQKALGIDQRDVEKAILNYTQSKGLIRYNPKFVVYL
jgi:hypothetical protein